MSDQEVTESQDLTPDPKRLEELEQFFTLKDVSLVPEAKLLLTEHNIEPLAAKLREKYAMLPPGWRGFFRSQSVLGTGSSFATGNVGLAARSPAKSEFTVSMSSALSGKADVSLVSAASTSTTASKPSSSDDASKSHIDLLIDEILQTEEQFAARIEDLRNIYVDKIYEVLGGKFGDEAITALGLSLEQANQVFTPLGEVVRFSRALLVKFTVISLVRTPPRSGKSRAEYTAEAFLAVQDRLKSFVPVITSYQASQSIIQEAANKVKSKRKKKHLDFMEWFDELSKSSDLLRGLTLDGVLSNPMQRIPRYVILLKELEKKCDESAKPKVSEALKIFSNAANEINEALKKHEKISKFFGAGSELKPVGATQSSGKEGSAKLRNQYVPNLPAKFQD